MAQVIVIIVARILGLLLHGQTGQLAHFIRVVMLVRRGLHALLNDALLLCKLLLLRGLFDW